MRNVFIYGFSMKKLKYSIWILAEIFISILVYYLMLWGIVKAEFFFTYDMIIDLFIVLLMVSLVYIILIYVFIKLDERLFRIKRNVMYGVLFLVLSFSFSVVGLARLKQFEVIDFNPSSFWVILLVMTLSIVGLNIGLSMNKRTIE